MNTLAHAFKEWAVICKALADGYQTLILRKGGIQEIGAGFQVEHERFWLFPTYVHQQETGVVDAALPMLRQVNKNRPPDGVVRLSHFAEVTDMEQVTELDRVLALGGMHFWSEETVRQRFHYRRPGLFVLTVRVYQMADAAELPNTAAYDGCRSWVELERALPTARAAPVLNDDEFRSKHESIKGLLSGGFGEAKVPRLRK